MTYCVALILDAGMVFASDSRTNAGVDQISVFRKMHVIKRDGERLISIIGDTSGAPAVLKVRGAAMAGATAAV